MRYPIDHVMLDVVGRDAVYNVFSSNIGDVGDKAMFEKLRDSMSNVSVTRTKTVHVKKEDLTTVDDTRFGSHLYV
jgi:hypothetical protein